MSARVVFRIRFANGRDVEDAVPYNSFRQMMSDHPGGRGRPPLQFDLAHVVQIAGRIISAPTFMHTFCQRPGRRGRRPLQFDPADVVGSSGRPRAASPTLRSSVHFANDRANSIKNGAEQVRPHISCMAFHSSAAVSRLTPAVCASSSGVALRRLSLVLYFVSSLAAFFSPMPFTLRIWEV